MDRDSAISLLKIRLKRVADTNIDTTIVTVLQHVQETILEENEWLPWFLLSEFLTITTTANEERIAVPTDVNFTGNNFLNEYENGALWRIDASLDAGRKLLVKDDYDSLYRRYKTSTGKPSHYSLDGDYFRLFPTPDDAYTLKMRCYLKDTRLDSNVENNWLKYAADWLMAETGFIIARDVLRDKVAEANMTTDIGRAKDRLLKKDIARKEANMEATMGDS